MPSIVVMVADGQRLLAEALGRALCRFDDIDVLDEHPPTGVEVIRSVSARSPEVVLLDYWMPGMDGPAATRMMLGSSPKVKVLLLTWLCGPAQFNEAFLAGASGFVSKSTPMPLLAEAIRMVRTGERVVARDGSHLERVEVEAQEQPEAVRAAALYRRLAALTSRESEVLRHLGEGHPVKQVARDLAISAGTVRNHVHSILRKTGVSTHHEAVTLARRARLIPDFGPPVGQQAPRFAPAADNG